ncbi:RloB domain-containing protein [Burkholderia ubonensis]|uniref:RloB domain-containing protein n=1 Tax=Burkholderia ubonensis TaxID=101571 RepID=UPI0009B3E99C
MPIELIVSWPCFEYWVLLHHRYSRTPYWPTRRSSGCDAVISDIRRNHDRKYEKAQPDIYAALKPMQATALQNAALAEADAKATGGVNPCTQVHTLVEKLLALNAV